MRCLQKLPISDKRSAPENWKMMQTFLDNIAGPLFSPRFDQQRYNSKSPLNFRQAVLTLEGSEWFMYERTWEQRLSLLFQRCKGVGEFHGPLFINVCHHVGVNLGVREFTLDGLDEGRPNGPGAAYALDIGGTSRETFSSARARTSPQGSTCWWKKSQDSFDSRIRTVHALSVQTN